MRVKELRQGLQSLKEMLSVWESKAAHRKDLERLLELLASYDELSVAEFCRRTEIALASTNGIGQTSTQKRKQVPNDALVSNYIKQLQSANLDRVALSAILSDIEANKKVRTIEMSAIANQVSGSDESFRSKKEAMKTVEGWAHRKLDTERRIKGASGIF